MVVEGQHLDVFERTRKTEEESRRNDSYWTWLPSNWIGQKLVQAYKIFLPSTCLSRVRSIEPKCYKMMSLTNDEKRVRNRGRRRRFIGSNCSCALGNELEKLSSEEVVLEEWRRRRGRAMTIDPNKNTCGHNWFNYMDEENGEERQGLSCPLSNCQVDESTKRVGWLHLRSKTGVCWEKEFVWASFKNRLSTRHRLHSAIRTACSRDLVYVSNFSAWSLIFTTIFVLNPTFQQTKQLEKRQELNSG